MEKTFVHYRKWYDVPENLKTKGQLEKMGLRPTGEVKATVYDKTYRVDAKLYDVSETKPKKVANIKKRIQLLRARKKAKEARTCKRCEYTFKQKLDEDRLCDRCSGVIWAENQFWKWKEDRDWIILDSETTGLWEEDEVVEIAILNGHGETLLDTLVKPKGTIPDEVIGIHGITNEIVEDAPTWPEVWDQVKEVITSHNVLIYNAEFDTRLIEQTCQKWGIEPVPFKSECVMHTYMMWYGADRWISLSDAIGYDVEHRALSDCLAVYRLIENEGREWVVKRELSPELIQLKKENDARLEVIWKEREEIWKRKQWEREQQELAEYYAFMELATSLEPIN